MLPKPPFYPDLYNSYLDKARRYLNTDSQMRMLKREILEMRRESFSNNISTLVYYKWKNVQYKNKYIYIYSPRGAHEEIIVSYIHIYILKKKSFLIKQQGLSILGSSLITTFFSAIWIHAHTDA